MSESHESQDTHHRQESGKSRDAHNLLTQGNLWAAIWVMSWPLLITTIVGSLVGLVDIQVAGMIGSPSQAAVGLAEQLVFLMMIFIMSVGVGTTAIVSRAYGAADYEQSHQATADSLGLSMAMGLILTAVTVLAASLIVPFVSTSGDVTAETKTYMQIFAFYLVPFSLTSIIAAAFRAIGDTKTPLVIMLLSSSINIAGDYLTVVSNWPLPGLGIRGIAWSALAASAAGALASLALLARSKLKPSYGYLLRITMDGARRILHVGIPSAFQRLSWAISTFILFFVLSRCSDATASLASWSIGVRVEALVFMPLMALSLAVSSIVGQNLGARQPERAVKAGWQVAWIGVGMMVAMALALFLGAEPLARLMSHDEQAVVYTASYLRINALAEPPLAIAMILSSALQGAGDTRTPMWITIFSQWVVRLPVAWLLALKLQWGPDGAWIAMSSSVTVMAILITWRYQSKAWLNIKV